jgi:hypothetical protein
MGMREALREGGFGGPRRLAANRRVAGAGGEIQIGGVLAKGLFNIRRSEIVRERVEIDCSA